MTRLIQFSTPSCGQCPQQAEILESLAVERSDVEFEKFDATEATEEANKVRRPVSPVNYCFG